MNLLLSIIAAGVSLSLFINPLNLTHASGNGSMSLTPSITGTPGQIITTPVMINTSGQNITGADISLQFDKTVLELTNIVIYPENSSLKDFLPVDFSTSPPVFAKTQIINSAKTTGIIEFSAITIGPTDVFNGVLDKSQPLASLQFKVLSNSPTSVIFNHTPNSTTDSNLVGPGEVEILSAVTNMNVNQPNQPVTYPESTPTPKPGDTDNDNDVDIFDYNNLLTNFGKTGSGVSGDFDTNNKVDIFDYNILLTNYGK